MNRMTIATGISVVLALVIVMFAYSATNTDAKSDKVIRTSKAACAAKDGDWSRKLCILPSGKKVTHLNRWKCNKRNGDFYRRACVIEKKSTVKKKPAPKPSPKPKPLPVPPTPEPEPDPTPTPDDPNPTPNPIVPVPDSDKITCTKANQAEVCPGGNTSSTGSGVCIVAPGETEGYCTYLYRLPCEASSDCSDYMGYDHYAICCRINSTSQRCLSNSLCRYTVEEYQELFGN